ncbi:MAG: hypothetical protein J1E43_10720 [Christensenellaceae bacterium]|nr:hypothetical protein [Christensenellaceae bacterium]
MKKLLCLLICLLLPFAALAEEIAPLSAEDFALTLEETAFALGGEAAALVEALEALTGAPLAVTETVSCMFSGMDREFANDAVLVGTYPIGPDGGDVVESVMVFTDALTTARGAAVGMTKEAVEALYGTDYFLDWDTMIYSLGALEPQLMFTLDLETGVVVSWMLLRNTVA